LIHGFVSDEWMDGWMDGWMMELMDTWVTDRWMMDILEQR